MVTFIETESNIEVTQAWGQGGNGELLFNGDAVSLWGNVHFRSWMAVTVTENMNVPNATELYT